MEQVNKGVTQHEIARNCDVGIRTIRRWVRAQGFPERKTFARRSKVDRHREYIEQRWNEGCHNATQLWHELRALGFTGQSPIVRRWLRMQYGSRRDRTKQHSPASKPHPSSPRQIAWAFLKEPEETRTYIAELCRRSPEIATCADLAREFVRIIRQRDVAAWCGWKDSPRERQSAGKLRKTSLSRRSCAACRPSTTVEQRASRGACPPPQVDQTLHVRPRQIRSATTPSRECRMKPASLNNPEALQPIHQI